MSHSATVQHYPTIAVDKPVASLLRQGQVHLDNTQFCPDVKTLNIDLPKGALVRITDAHDNFLGIGTYSPHNPTALRILCREDRLIDSAFFTEKLSQAHRLREHLFDAPYYRLCNSDSDGISGLIIDRHGDTLCIQCETAGMDRVLSPIVNAIETLFSPTTIILKNDCDNRVLEGVATESQILKGNPNHPLKAQENGLVYYLDSINSKRTGYDYAHRDNRAFVSTLCEDKTVVDFYTYAGGFALPCVASGARQVVAVDKSPDSLAWALQSAQANGLDDQIQFRHTDCIKEMTAMAQRAETYDVVLCHPPASDHSGLSLALKKYRKLARLSAQITNSGGTLMLSCATPKVTQNDFMQQVALGLNDANRTGLIWHMGTAGADHPVHPSLPETAFLKCLILQID